MRKILFALIACCLLSTDLLKAQVGINILIPDSSAILQLESNKKGLGLSRLTTPEMNAVWKPLKGLTVFNTTDSVIEYWNGQCWLKAYEKNCYECAFGMTINHTTDTLDRTYADSVFSTVTILQTHGTQDINLTWTAVPPPGVQVSMQGASTIDSAGKVKLIVKADVFAGGGNFSILLIGFCDDQVHFITYNVYVKPCIVLTIPTDVQKYNLQANNSTVLPAGARECVQLTVFNGVEVTAGNPTDPAYKTGNLNPLSIVGIINNGCILGRGGDGGDFSGNVLGGKPGVNGGNAMELSTKTVINNYGAIFAGGGGGASIGLSTSFTVFGINITLGFGVGGGGGSESGKGGAPPSGIGLGVFKGGGDATAGCSSVPGLGGSFSAPIPISAGPVTITVTPTGGGGNGGAFAKPGTQGTIGICLSVGAFGITINLGCLPIPLPFPGGQPGLAIKRNGNPLQNIVDGSYYSNQIKGNVTP